MLTTKQYNEVTKVAEQYRTTDDDDIQDKAEKQLASMIYGTYHEILAQFVEKGPVEDGDCMSKSLRDDLIEWGLLNKVLVNGEWGYTAANYMGGHVYNRFKELTEKIK